VFRDNLFASIHIVLILTL
jgi:hypothetical protein